MENFYAVYKFNKYLPMNPPKRFRVLTISKKLEENPWILTTS